jgi:hypothetical protein
LAVILLLAVETVLVLVVRVLGGTSLHLMMKMMRGRRMMQMKRHKRGRGRRVGETALCAPMTPNN